MQRRIEEEIRKKSAAGETCPQLKGFWSVLSDEREKAKAGKAT